MGAYLQDSGDMWLRRCYECYERKKKGSGYARNRAESYTRTETSNRDLAGFTLIICKPRSTTVHRNRVPEFLPLLLIVFIVINMGVSPFVVPSVVPSVVINPLPTPSPSRTKSTNYSLTPNSPCLCPCSNSPFSLQPRSSSSGKLLPGSSP